MVKDLRVRRPLAFIDAETAGVARCRDRIIAVAMMRFAPDVEPCRGGKRGKPPRLPRGV